jgi:uncharacterized protein
MDTFVIDTFEFCRHKERGEGQIAITDLPRLAGEAAERSGVIQWTLVGGVNVHGHPQMNLVVNGAVRLVCQRCLKPFEFVIDSSAVVVVATDEQSADQLDALLAEESVEVIVGSKSFDIRALIEDEALLAIPLSPKHEVCPDQIGASQEAVPEKSSPFAILKSLKK